MEICVDGIFKTVPDPPFNLAAAKGAKLARLQQRATEAMMLWKPTALGHPLAGHSIQVGRPQDQLNLDQSLTRYKRKIDRGSGADIKARFRTLSNEDVLVSYQRGYEIIVDEIGDWGAAIRHRTWDQANLIALAVDQLALDAIDIETGWPTE